MTWPIYPYHGADDALDRHRDRMASGFTRSGAASYSLALDIWREGEHLWSSYLPQDSESLLTWADRELPAGTALNFDDGAYRVAGLVNCHIWPIPTESAMVEVPSLAALRDLLATTFAIGQLPGAPMGLDLVPPENTLLTRLRRRGGAPLTWTAHETISGVSIRAVIRYAQPRLSPAEVTMSRYQARLRRRDVREGASDIDLPEREAFITSDESPRSIIRAAKGALGVQGWPAQRRNDSLVWYLTKAPYLIEVRRVDTAGNPA